MAVLIGQIFEVKIEVKTSYKRMNKLKAVSTEDLTFRNEIIRWPVI